MYRVVHFEIHADNTERAMKFYGNCFGWAFQRWEAPMEYWLVRTGDPSTPGIDGGLVKRRGAINGESIIAYPCTIQVDKIDEIQVKIQFEGGRIVVPKFPIPGVGWLFYAQDTEGNIFGVTERDTSAG